MSTTPHKTHKRSGIRKPRSWKPNPELNRRINRLLKSARIKYSDLCELAITRVLDAAESGEGLRAMRDNHIAERIEKGAAA